jgi:hypothetical protein
MLDDLPSATSSGASDGKLKKYNIGFLFGSEGKDNSEITFYNHHHIIILYRKSQKVKDRVLVTGFEVVPESIKSHDTCPGSAVRREPLLIDEQETEISYTYKVTWIEDHEINWSHRWV